MEGMPNYSYFYKYCTRWVRFEVPMSPYVKMTAFWLVAPCSLVEVYPIHLMIGTATPLKRRKISTRLHGAAIRKTEIFTVCPLFVANICKQSAKRTERRRLYYGFPGILSGRFYCWLGWEKQEAHVEVWKETSWNTTVYKAKTLIGVSC
jgi:hypothetical protein